MFNKFLILWWLKKKINYKQKKGTKLRFLSSGSGMTKMVVSILIVFFASAVAGIGYYTATRPSLPSKSPTPTPTPNPTPSPLPTPTLPPTPTYDLTPTPKPSPTPTKLPTPTATATPTPTGTPMPTPNPTELTTQEKVRDAIMSFVKSNHPETAQFMKELEWTGGRVTPSNLVGAETYRYYSQGWNITISYPVVQNTIYSIVADYSAIGISIPYRIIWNGTWQNEVINETSYVFAQ
jgi:hypothetical protein